MKKNKGIFDLMDVNDLPKNLQELCSKKMWHGASEKKILYLFSLKKELRNKEIVIGLYRVFKKEVNAYYTSRMLHKMAKKGFLTRIKYGLYKLNEELK
jgi:hypothetical protein